MSGEGLWATAIQIDAGNVLRYVLNRCVGECRTRRSELEDEVWFFDGMGRPNLPVGISVICWFASSCIGTDVLDETRALCMGNQIRSLLQEERAATYRARSSACQ